MSLYLKKLNNTLVKEHYSLAEAEIKLENSINNLTSLMDGFESSEKPKYLLEAIANQQQKLLSIRNARAA